jgi:hypothetical protein
MLRGLWQYEVHVSEEAHNIISVAIMDAAAELVRKRPADLEANRSNKNPWVEDATGAEAGEEASLPQERIPREGNGALGWSRGAGTEADSSEAIPQEAMAEEEAAILKYSLNCSYVFFPLSFSFRF